MVDLVSRIEFMDNGYLSVSIDGQGAENITEEALNRALAVLVASDEEMSKMAELVADDSELDASENPFDLVSFNAGLKLGAKKAFQVIKGGLD